MNIYNQPDYMNVQLYFDGVDYTTISIPKTEYKPFLNAWMNGEIYKNNNIKEKVLPGGIRMEVKTGSEYIRLSEVKRIVFL